MTTRLQLGVIADDYTGASDLGSRLRERGAAAALVFGVPEGALVAELASTHDSLIVGLKSRSVEPSKAVRLSIAALERLAACSPRQLQFKYCSTFDSTRYGNIGPVIDALLDAQRLEFTIAVPSLPANGRTQYSGHLFVQGVPLGESPMRTHPTTPMTDSNLVRHLQPQTRRRVGLIPLEVVTRGVDGIREAADQLWRKGYGIALVDAIDDRNLAAIADAFVRLPLVTGGSGITEALVDAWRGDGWVTAAGSQPAGGVPAREGGIIVAGSCSLATLDQLCALEEANVPVVRLDPAALARGELQAARTQVAHAWRVARTGSRWCAITASQTAEARASVHASLPAERIDPANIGPAIEAALATCARDIVETGSPAVVCVAGGETSAAVVDALGVEAVTIGPPLAPGVPVLYERSARRLVLVLKSGNFGPRDFFLRVMECAPTRRGLGRICDE
jgi:uncharacterized protein YgbK (DUF1537 family)